MAEKTIRLFVAALLLAATTGLARAGDISVLSNGAPVGGAKVSLETLDGKHLSTTRTGANGIAKNAIPETSAGQPVAVKVTDQAGNVSRQTYAQPSGKPSELVAMDTEGGIIGYDKETADHLKRAKEPLEVGANGDVGCSAKLKEKVKETAGGLLSGAVGGFLGGGGSPFGGGGSPFGSSPGGSGGGKDIETKDDPIPQESKRVFTDAATGTKIAVGTKMTPDGLQVSTDILDAPCDGTFQSVHLMDAQGNLAGPTRYDVYEMYQDWKLTVSWTYDRWVNGQHVEHKQGGWSEETRNILGTFSVPHGRDGIWGRMRFGTAVEGIKSLGAFFPAGPRMFKTQPMTLVVHVTNPDAEPVTTIPFVIGLAIKYAEAATLRSELQIEIDELESLIKYKKKSLESTKRFWGKLAEFPNPIPKQIIKIEDELRNLERKLNELKTGVDPVIDHLQPIVIIA